MTADGLLAEARSAAAGGDRERLHRIGHAALDPSLHLVLRIDLANCLRDAGLPQWSECILLDLIEACPRSPLAYFELAFIRRQQERLADAARILEAGVRACGAETRLLTFRAHMLHALGAHADADRVLARARPATPQDAAGLEVMAEFGQYLRDHPPHGAQFRLEALRAARGMLTTEQVVARIEQARAARRPFALVRLGDGEGAWTRMGRAEEHAHRHLFAANRAEFSGIWFGEDFDAATGGFADLAAGVADVALEADVVGVPYDAWLRHEYAIASTRGIPSLVNLCRALTAQRGAAAFCRQDVHRGLHMGGALARMLREERRIGLISCHPELPECLARHFRLDEVEFHRIPGEVGRAAMITGAADLGMTHPEAFAATDAALASPHHGRLFLVAGGVLGKYYALTIRRHGGIALDIGSLADGWLRRPTRPDYGEHLALASATP